MEGRVRPDCVNASNPYHHCAEYCSSNQRSHTHGSKPVRKGDGRSEDEGRRNGREVRNVDPRCVNASNPYHQCADYCHKRMTNGAVKSGSAPRIEGKEGSKMGEKRKVDPNCPNATNPYHECAEHCLKRIHEKDHTIGGKPVVTANRSKEGMKVAERSVDPKCVNADNPYHKCSEYCFRRINQVI